MVTQRKTLAAGVLSLAVMLGGTGFMAKVALANDVMDCYAGTKALVEVARGAKPVGAAANLVTKGSMALLPLGRHTANERKALVGLSNFDASGSEPLDLNGYTVSASEKAASAAAAIGKSAVADTGALGCANLKD